MTITKILLCLFIGAAGISYANEPATEFNNYKQKYPGENGVFIVKSENVNIELNKAGEVDINAEVYEEKMLLNDNAKFFTEDKISHSSFILVDDVKPEAWLPDGKKYNKIKIKDFKVVDDFSDNSFYDDVKSTNFRYPSLVAGAKTILYYKEQYMEPRFFGQFFFGSFLPVEKSTLTITVEKGINIKFTPFNIPEEKMKFTRTEGKKDVTYQWTMTELDKYRSEDGSVNIRSVIPHIVVYVADYEVDGEKKQLLSGVNDLFSWYRGLADETGVGEKPELLKHIVDSLKQNAHSEYDLVEKVYYWVQDNIKYIAIEDGLGGFIPRDATTVYTRRYGDCKDMSNIIHEMLKIAGVPSHLTWIGTRDIPYSYEQVPTPIVDNHMICTYISGDRYYFLDATNQFTPMQLPSSFIQGKEALIDRGEGRFEVVKVPEVDLAVNITSDTSRIAIVDGKVKGSGNVTLTGYSKIGMTYNLTNLDETRKQKYLRAVLNKGNNKYFLENIVEKNVRERNEGVSIAYDFTIEDYAKVYKDEIFLNPHLTKPLQSSKIDISTNTIDKERSYRKKEINVVEVEIPEGYMVQYLPEDISFREDEFGFKLRYSTVGNKIIIDQEIDLNYLVLKSQKFESWNEMVLSLNNAYSETIILKKK